MNNLILLVGIFTGIIWAVVWLDKRQERRQWEYSKRDRATFKNIEWTILDFLNENAIKLTLIEKLVRRCIELGYRDQIRGNKIIKIVRKLKR
jgi:hypothetical protein